MIRLAESDTDIERCFPVVQQLRTRLVASEFLATVRRQMAQGYQLAFVQQNGRVAAAAGFRVYECLSDGRTLYVDDLVTDAELRSRGHGAALMAWLVERARAERCRQLVLDSAVERFDAHRFYLTNRFVIRSHHFQLEI